MCNKPILAILAYILVFFQLPGNGQVAKENALNGYLFRNHMEKDSSWVEPNTNCYYVRGARMNMNHGGWHWADDLEQYDGDFFYWETETWGMVKIEFDLPTGTIALNLDTISKLNYDFINYFFGYARSDSTVDHLAGILTFTPNGDTAILIDGTITIKSEKPITRQQIVFKTYMLKILSLSEAIDDHKARQDKIRRKLRGD